MSSGAAKLFRCETVQNFRVRRVTGYGYDFEPVAWEEEMIMESGRC